jgi:DNA-binding response OmpR family regulator
LLSFILIYSFPARKASLPGSDSWIVAGPFRYNTTTLRFYKNDEEITLSAKENAVMVYVNRLRQKIEENTREPRYLHTIVNVGYKLTPFGLLDKN